MVPALALMMMSGCGTSTVPADDVATEAEEVLGPEFGSEVTVECDDDLPGEKDAEITCLLTDPSTDDTYDMTAVVTEVDGSNVNMTFTVAPEPN
uniref:DUF4333 domain-containing protein n=1 Tax=uncultured Nocardioidaceae bacterium TaxID=253824 RepID=A0A6J4KW73_9ACTN|nr:MAG: hypothetical protein AVDCRST_MAG46-506 [uncultured Nocardioidaceae bacterium]